MEAPKKRYTAQWANMVGMTISKCGLMESPPRLGLGTILGPLGQSLVRIMCPKKQYYAFLFDNKILFPHS